MKFKRIIMTIFLIAAGLTFSLFVALIAMNFYVKSLSKDRILSVSDACDLTDLDCVIVLGCKVYSDNKPSPCLETG